jgi:hypothetical protein
MVLNAAVALTLSIALAQDAPSSFRDGQGALDALAAEVSSADVVAAIDGSESKFRPRDVYTLVDGGAPEEVVRVMAGKAGVFVSDDVLMTLAQFAAGARGGAAPQSFVVANGGFGLALGRLAELGADKETMERGMRRSHPRAEDETIRAYDTRIREAQREQVLATAQIDGQIEAVNVELKLKVSGGTFDAATGCGEVNLEDAIDLAYLPFRGAIGADDSRVPVALESRIIDVVWFDSTPKRRFSATSKGVCMAEADFNALVADTTLKGALRRTAEGNWSGDLEMVDGYGDRIRTRR